MERFCTSQQMKVREEFAVTQGISLLQLMENAGCGAAKDLLLKHPSITNVLIICGKGNNAGDGLVMARILAESNIKVTVCFILGTKFSSLTQINYERLPTTVRIIDKMIDEKLDDFDVVVDALFGTGFHGELIPRLQKIIAKINESPSMRIALDIPSGINADLAVVSENSFKATYSYVFDSYKPLHKDPSLKKYYGNIILVDIGIPN